MAVMLTIDDLAELALCWTQADPLEGHEVAEADVEAEAEALAEAAYNAHLQQEEREHWAMLDAIDDERDADPYAPGGSLWYS